MLKVSVSLGEFGNDIKKALETEQDVTFAPPSRNMITLPQGLVNPGTMDPQGDKEDKDAFAIRERLHTEATNRYEEAVLRQKFDQETENIKYKAAVSEHAKRENAYKRNKSRAFAILIKDYCTKIMQERLEELPDYDSTIKDDPIIALTRTFRGT